MSINYGTSVYHHVAGIYQRNGDILEVSEGRHADQIRSYWAEILQSTSTSKLAKTTELPSNKTITTYQRSLKFRDQPETIQIHELHDPYKKTVRGLVTFDSTDLDPAFFTWSITFLLLSSRFLTASVKAQPTTQALETAERITTLFESTLKNTSADDKWLISGREFFLSKVASFTKDNKRIELCLPAFPCKSSNPEKVGGVLPDDAEDTALEHLHSFVAQVAEVYKAGATLWVVSDGHVFSDCIGVDDALVDTYGQTLANNYRARYPGSTLIQFTGLEDLFFSSAEATSAFNDSMLEQTSIPQPIETVLTDSAQKCRLLLERVGGIDRSHLRGLIDEKHADTLGLYQGQSRFMLEDLGGYMDSRNMGGKARKRVSGLVAGEMIARNHAYSNLVELLFPHHMRLSIHAHSNTGPKFGIRLFPKDSVRTVQDTQSLITMSDATFKPTYEFQIPTPWHNSLTRVEGSGVMLLTKARVVRDAVREGMFEGGWTGAGYFSIKRVEGEDEDTAVEAEVDSACEEVTLADETELPAKNMDTERKGTPEQKKKNALRVIGVFVWEKIVGFWGAVRAVLK